MAPVAIDRPWVRRGTVAVFLLAALSPAFDRAAAAVGYAEPLENAAEATGAIEHATTITPGLMPDYGVPGLPGSLGMLIAGVTGTALVLGLGLMMGRLLSDDPGD